MTTRSGARIYRRPPKPLAPGACPHCTRVIHINPNGRRRHHHDLDGHPCGGSGLHVGGWAPVILDELPDVVIPEPRRRNPWSGRAPEPKPPDPRLCECGQRPKRKKNGDFAAHRSDPDNPVSAYCPYGAPRSG